MQGNCIEVTTPVKSDMHNMPIHVQAGQTELEKMVPMSASLWSKSSSHGSPKMGSFLTWI